MLSELEPPQPLEEVCVERGRARRSSLKGRERVIVSQRNMGLYRFKGDVGEPLTDGVERIWAFPSAQISSFL